MNNLSLRTHQILKLSINQLFKLSHRNLINEASSKSETLARDWNITIGKTDDDSAYTVRLNNINLKTPLKNLLKIKDETLALAVANEWKSRAGKKKLDLVNMHLTTLAYEAIDNPFNETKEVIADSLIEYLKYDTVRFREVGHEELLKRQSRHWDPIIGWFEHKYECHLPIDYNEITATGTLPKKTQEIFARMLHSHERWPLVGFKYMTQNLKSFVLATSLKERFLNVDQAVDLSRLETNFQTEKWSRVEWEHDIDEHCTKARVAAGNLFYHLSI